MTRAFRLRTALLLPLTGLLLLAAACPGEPPAMEEVEAPEIWRFAIEETRGSVQDHYAQRFKQLIEERTDGQVLVIVYPYGTLGTSDQLTEQLNLGLLELAMASPGHLGTLIPEIQVLLLHFVFSDDEDVNHEALADPEVRAAFDELFAEKGFQLMTIYQSGWQAWTARQAIRSPDDFRGVKLRIMTSPLLAAAYNAYGASPTPLPFGEVYSGLQLRMIDAQENPVFAIQEMSFHEVQDYLIFANQAPFVATALANRDFYQGLSEERRRLVDEVVAELDHYVDEVQRRLNRERLELMTTSGWHYVDDYVARAREHLLEQRDGIDAAIAELEGYLQAVEETGSAPLTEQMEVRREALKPVVPELLALNNHVAATARETSGEALATLGRRADTLEVIHLTPEERAHFRELSIPVRDRFVELAGPRGKELLETLLAAVARAEERVQAER